MRWHVAWPRTVSGWCFWASLVVLLGVVMMTLLGVLVLLTGADEVMEILWNLVRFGFAAVVATFLLGIVCSLARVIMGQRGGGWPL